MTAPNPAKHLLDPRQAATHASLHYVTGMPPGLTRRRAGQGFVYHNAQGRQVKDPAVLARIRSLVIPPAWKNVWICASPHGHLQALGIDARGRKQYRYHPRWRQVRDQAKFEHILDFARVLPRIRRTTARHLMLSGLPKEKILAAVVMLLEKTLIRVGNDEYARDNHSFGLTTIHDKHVQVTGKRIHFAFKGKSGVYHNIDIEHPRLARIVKKCQDLPGQEVFAYLDHSGKEVDVKSTDVNQYLQKISGRDFTAKDFRTWAATVLAAKALAEISAFDSQAQARKNVVAAVESVAQRLGNTTSVCRKCYIHPEIINAYLDGSLVENLQRQTASDLCAVAHLRPQEAAVLVFLQERLRRDSASKHA
jgi:DNA topoisomerase-1